MKIEIQVQGKDDRGIYWSIYQLERHFGNLEWFYTHDLSFDKPFDNIPILEPERIGSRNISFYFPFMEGDI